MNDPIDDMVARRQRESHGAMMLAGVLITLLLVGVVFVTLQNAPVLKEVAPPGAPLNADIPRGE